MSNTCGPFYFTDKRYPELNYKIQEISQNGIGWVADALIHISGTISTSHPALLLNIEIPLVSSVSAGFVLGMVRG